MPTGTDGPMERMANLMTSLGLHGVITNYLSDFITIISDRQPAKKKRILSGKMDDPGGGVQLLF